VTAVEFSGVFIHDAADLDDFSWFRHASQPAMVDPRTTPVIYADGSVGAVLRPGSPRFFEFSLPYASDEDVWELGRWVQRFVLLRGSRQSLRAYGHIVGLSSDPLKPRANTATITFAESTFREAS
jgi:hypothetical protein